MKAFSNAGVMINDLDKTTYKRQLKNETSNTIS